MPAPAQSRSAYAPSAAYLAPAHPSPSLAAAQPPASDTTSSLARRQNVAGWTADGGTPIVVALGETADVIARRYGIPPEALLRTNGFSASSQVRPGTRLIVPIYNAALAVSSGAHLAEQRAKPNEKLVFVKGPKPADAARSANNETDKSETKAPVLRAKEASRDQLQKSEAAKLENSAPDAEAKAKALVAGKETAKPGDQKVILAKAQVSATDPKRPGLDPTATASVSSDSPEFRWPAHGRIIQAFKRNGNDGINIALPEGTSVRAAEAGVVAYAGNELKGYGNLVLIRHPNGFVTAYANNGELDVKRGDTVTRGQVIAKSGQSGNVASPQLHFEVRKGTTPVDPTQYLATL
ncbi:MAG: peptidoglycan DD-metalloendopeptidase family protein [Beijerinckiaceae bacterium]